MEKKKDEGAVSLGRKGRAATLKKYGLEAFKEWGKKGGRPKKAKAMDPTSRKQTNSYPG
jgi:hypothetical protein